MLTSLVGTRIFIPMQSGCKNAADILILQAEENAQQRFVQMNFLVYPIAFLYRQYCKLRLKEIILLGNRLDNKPVSIPPHQRIDTLWSSARSYVKATSPSIPRDVFRFN
jgi:hypothetical protein